MFQLITTVHSWIFIGHGHLQNTVEPEKKKKQEHKAASLQMLTFLLLRTTQSYCIYSSGYIICLRRHIAYSEIKLTTLQVFDSITTYWAFTTTKNHFKGWQSCSRAQCCLVRFGFTLVVQNPTFVCTGKKFLPFFSLYCNILYICNNYMKDKTFTGKWSFKVPICYIKQSK